MTTKHQSMLAMEFCGLKFNTPLVLLSGCVGFGEEYTRIEGFSNREVGAVCLKGTTLKPRLGNAPHRVCDTTDGSHVLMIRPFTVSVRPFGPAAAVKCEDPEVRSNGIRVRRDG